MELQKKVILFSVLLSVIPVVVLGTSIYFFARNSIFELTQEKLSLQVQTFRDDIAQRLSQTNKTQNKARENARTILEQQAVLVHETCRQWSGSEEALKDWIARIQVDTTGYVYVLNYDGRYVVSKNRSADGKDISQLTDTSGRLFIQDIVRKGRGLVYDNIDFDIYSWLSPGETVPRNRISAIFHLPKRKWIVGISNYYDDFTYIDQVRIQKEKFIEKLMAQKVGAQGCMYVINSKGDVLAHPKSLAKNVLARDYAKKICQTKEGVLEYSWEGSRMIAAFSYFAPLDWIIVSGSQVKDFFILLDNIRSLILWVGSVILLAAVMLGLSVAGEISKSPQFIGLVSQIHKKPNQTANTSGALSSAVTRKVAGIGEAAFSLKQICTVASRKTRDANETKYIMKYAQRVVDEANGSMERLTQSMGEIFRDSQETYVIMKTIDEIAFKINQLALNVSAESAKAGESGNSFTAVTDDVRNLAMKASDIAMFTSQLLERMMTHMSEGVRFLAETNEAFEDVTKSVGDTDEMLSRISQASKEQSNSIRLINSVIAQMEQAIQEHSFKAGKSAAESEEMNAQTAWFRNFIMKLAAPAAGKSGSEESANASWMGNGGIDAIQNNLPAVPIKTKKSTSLNNDTGIRSQDVISSKKDIDIDDAFVDF
ncbi:MAG: hypothetical protein GY729_02560 [Desulfobacteraceae bacterium]|nr:hypothetical protein [Desulfobacteraceae bacterium]